MNRRSEAGSIRPRQGNILLGVETIYTTFLHHLEENDDKVEIYEEKRAAPGGRASEMFHDAHGRFHRGGGGVSGVEHHATPCIGQ